VVIPEATELQLENLADGGRGLMIVKQAMDEVAYRSHDDGRNVLSMSRRLRGLVELAPGISSEPDAL
jgi:anti-sigma regulatory factor (Ser/Thr protein kinase)